MSRKKVKIPAHHRVMEWLLILLSIAVCLVFYFIVVF